uniref:Uncharacterized protein n=1 Tax=Myotis myotis TaxID=51298 RepID=A0A7J7XZT6_MYOMY|nr:hypothetical protein mMyoMyo1_011381 [Myotis myotis]
MPEDSCKNKPSFIQLLALASLWHPGPRLLCSSCCQTPGTWAASLWLPPPPTGPRLRWSMPPHGNQSFGCDTSWPFIIMTSGPVHKIHAWGRAVFLSPTCTLSNLGPFGRCPTAGLGPIQSLCVLLFSMVIHTARGDKSHLLNIHCCK